MDMERFRDWILEDPRTRVPLTLTLLGVLLVVPLCGFGLYLWKAAARGDHPRLAARTIRGLAIFFFAAAAGLMVMLWRFAVLITPNIRP
jgi:hypothetical protein